MVSLPESVMNKMMHVAGTLRLDRLLFARGSVHAFTDVFKGFEKVEAVRRIFDEETETVLENLRVEFTWIDSYMWVNSANGHLVVSTKYLNNGNKVDVYLDVIHELVHIRQLVEGKELFDSDYAYADRPTEIEAYRYVVDEARRLGLSEERICQYLKTEWMSDEDFERLARSVGVKCKPCA